MKWKIELKDNCEKELCKLDRHSQIILLKYLYNRVAKLSHPKQLGKALHHDLKGLWRYRVNQFRIICRTQENKLIVLVIQIGQKNIN